MNRSFRPLFLTGFSILWIGAVAVGLLSAQAGGRKNRKSTAHNFTVALDSSLFTEDFSYPEGSLLSANGWNVHDAGGATPNPVSVVAPGLTYPGYAGNGIGNAVTTGAPGQDLSKPFTAATSGTVYASFMVNVASSQTAGDYFFHLLNFGTNVFRARVFARKDPTTSNFAFGLSRTSGTPVYTATNYAPGTTYLVVVKYQYVAGPSNDVVQLFVDPVPSGAEPALATLTATDADATEPAQLSGVALRQGNAANAPNQKIDGIRVGTTWEGALNATQQKRNVDMNGDGRTDFAITRESVAGFNAGSSAFTAVGEDPTTRRMRLRQQRLRLDVKNQTSDQVGPAAVGNYQWWVAYNNAPGGRVDEWGLAQEDDIVSADFDGDNADDLAIWRPGPPLEAGFYSINSSDFTFRFSQFGQTGDDVSVVGDYDGDGKDDDATFRCPETPGECAFWYRGSLNNPGEVVTYVPWGFGLIEEWIPNPGDFNGDGKYDFCLQDIRGFFTEPQTDRAPQWLWLNGSPVSSHEVIDWGLTSDFVIPGDFDGDGRSDFAVRREEGPPDFNDLVYYILERDGGVRVVQWGVFGDIQVPGDYDGDGSQDIAIYRWNATDATFWILPSNGNPHWTYTFGLPGDEPVASWYVQ